MCWLSREFIYIDTVADEKSCVWWVLDLLRGEVVGGGLVREWAFRRVSKILFGKMVWSSFMWLLEEYSAYM
jgi:hypothetical protein